jgi:serine/threonine-protein kinase
MSGRTIGNYEVVSRIGEGGMGVVYLGKHLTLGRPAAIKVLRPELSHPGGRGPWRVQRSVGAVAAFPRSDAPWPASSYRQPFQG